MAYIEFNEHGGGGGYRPRTEILLSHYGALNLSLFAELSLAEESFTWFDVHPLLKQEFVTSFQPVEEPVDKASADILAFVAKDRVVKRSIGGIILGAEVSADFARSVLDIHVPELSAQQREKIFPDNCDYYFTRENGISMHKIFTVGVIDKNRKANPIVYQHPSFTQGLAL